MKSVSIFTYYDNMLFTVNGNRPADRIQFDRHNAGLYIGRGI